MLSHEQWFQKTQNLRRDWQRRGGRGLNCQSWKVFGYSMWYDDGICNR